MQYKIEGEPLPVLVCRLEQNESMITEGGSMAWMSPNMRMETTTNGGLGKVFGRALSGERLFQNIYTAENGKGMIAFASSFPGQIRAFEIDEAHPMILQKSAFLASTRGIELSVFFNKSVTGGLFGGEGFIMQKLTGRGMAFAEFDGHVVEYELKAGQRITVGTGHIAAMEASCSMDVQTVKGAKNLFFGGEGIFLTNITGPGRIWLQSMPVSGLAQTLIPYLPLNNGN